MKIRFKRRVHKYTGVSGVDGSVGLLDYVLIGGYMNVRLMDVNAPRGVTAGMSDHYLVEIKVRISGRVDMKVDRR